MLSPTELLKKVQRIEIKSRQLSSMIFSGEYHSRFKGRGMHFSEVRDYHFGDDIRAIDWNVTARYNSPFVKVFEEEREIVVMILIDISSSNFFGTTEQVKQELAVEIAAVLAFSAIQNKDQIGVTFFSSDVEKSIPPKKGKKHVLRIVRELLAIESTSKKTNIQKALQHFNTFQKRKSVVFLISDFLDSGYEKSLRVVNSRHDFMCIKLNDKREYEIPDVGFARFKDLETGREKEIDTSDKKVRENYAAWKKGFNEKTENLLKKMGVDYVNINTGEKYTQQLIKLFEKRG